MDALLLQNNGTDNECVYPLRLPKPNVFIPTDFSLRPITPELLVSVHTLYIKHDVTSMTVATYRCVHNCL
jgi:hypothetical protein